MLPILYQDSDIVVVNKPVGMLTHATKQCDDAASCMSILRNQLGKWVYPLHRLDRATSGILAFGLSPEIAKAIGKSFMERDVEKVYVAITRGHLPASGRIDKPQRLEATSLEREAITEFRALAHIELPWPVRPYSTSRYTLAELTPLTGRTHQLRKHMHSLSHPIIGDTKYGDGRHNEVFANHFGGRRLMLHAAALRFPHPLTKEPIHIQVGPGDLFKSAIALFPTKFLEHFARS